MTPEHKENLRQARAAAREARKNAVEAEIAEPGFGGGGNAELSEVEALRAELAALKEKHREKAAHEHETITGREKINDRVVSGVQGEVQEALREMIREQLQETFPERTPVRKTSRDTVRPNAVVAIDRDGNPIYRKRSATTDPFAIPEDLQDPAWDRAWIRVSTYGQEDTSNQVSRFEQGWRFVNADRPGWEARFMPPGYKGHIYKDGLALVERPMILTEEAKREAAQDVKTQSRAQREQFGLALPQGFSDQTAAARANSFARAGAREQVPDSLRPELRVGQDID